MPNVNRTVQLGDREVLRMGMGTNRLTERPANIDIIRAAADAGIGLIDTAHLYTGGSSEETIGAALGAPDMRARVVVATKGGFGGAGQGRPEVLRAQIEQSLRALRTDAIDLYYLHRVDPETPLEESLGAIAEFRERGMIRNVGISAVSVDQIERARRIVPIAAVQNQYNVADRASEAVVDYCTGEGIIFVPFYPLHGEHPGVEAMAKRRSATQAQIALAWLLRRSPQILPIPGTLSIDHLRENVGALQIGLTDQEYESLS